MEPDSEARLIHITQIADSLLPASNYCPVMYKRQQPPYCHVCLCCRNFEVKLYTTAALPARSRASRRGGYRMSLPAFRPLLALLGVQRRIVCVLLSKVSKKVLCVACSQSSAISDLIYERPQVSFLHC